MHVSSENNAHCFKHAYSYPSEERGCPYCETNALVRQIVLDYAAERWPNANRRTHPWLMRELDRYRKA